MGRLEGSTNLDPKLKEFIYCKALLHPRIPRATLATALKYEIEAEEREDWRVPSQDNLEKMISSARNHHSPLDEPWSLSCLAKKEYDIPPEALPTVLGAWAQYRRQGAILTIREALWFSRLSSVLLEFEKVGDKNRNLGNLMQWYAIRERAYEAIGKDTDTTDLDTAVLQLLKLEEEKEEDKTLPWVYEDGYIKDATGKIRGQIRALDEDPLEPKGQKKKGGKP